MGKREFSLGIIVPTRGDKAIVQYWIDKLSFSLKKRNADLVFFLEQGAESEYGCYENIIFDYYSGEVDDVLCEKVYSCARKYSSKYDYIWIVRDRMIVDLEAIFGNLVELFEQNKDFLIVYPHYTTSSLKKDYEDSNELILDLCGEMTSLGSIIFSQRVLSRLVLEYPVDPKKNRGLWLPMALFDYLGTYEFQATFLMGQYFVYIPYTGSFWIKKRTLLPLFSERWNEMVDSLPPKYDAVRERVRGFENWSFSPYSIELVIQARLAKDITIKRLVKYWKSLRRLSSEVYFFLRLIVVSLIPIKLIEFIRNCQSKGRGSIVIKLFNTSINAWKVLASFFNVKYSYLRMDCESKCREISEISNVETSDLILGTPNQEQLDLSIIIPTFQRPRDLGEALRSINRLYSCNYEWEIIIVDNESCTSEESETEKVIKENWNERIVYYRNRRNLGAVGSMNQGVHLANGRWIAFLHDDDVLFDDYLIRFFEIKNYLETMKCNPGMICSTTALVRDEKFFSDEGTSDNFLVMNYNAINARDKFVVYPVEEKQIAFLGDSGMSAPSFGCAYLRKAYLDAGCMKEETVDGIMADVKLGYRIMQEYGVYRCKVPFGIYRWGQNESSKRISSIMKAYYEFRNTKYDVFCGAVTKYILRAVHIKQDKDIYQTFDHFAANRTYKKLVDYKYNWIYECYAKIIRKTYLKKLEKKKIDCR